MRAACSATIFLRLCALLVFLSYLLTGASLALPTEMRCARCAKTGQPGAMKTGASCPLSYNGQHCHHGHEKPSSKISKITLCPDGCLHHGETGGEIPPLVKFLSPLARPFPPQLPLGLALSAQLDIAPDPALPPLEHPPPVLRS